MDPQLLAAINALYHAADAAQHASANAWLMSYQATPAAWHGAIALLRSPANAASASELRYFGSTLLHAKVKAEWMFLPANGGLPKDQQAALTRECMQILSECVERGDTAVASKVALTLACMASRVPGGPTDLIKSMIPSVMNTTVSSPSSFPSPPSSPQSPAATNTTVASLLAPASRIFLELLIALGDEVARLPLVNYARTEEVTSQLRSCAGSVLTIVGSFLKEGTQMMMQGDARPNTILVQCISVIHAWSHYGIGIEQLHFAGLLRTLGPLFSAALRIPDHPLVPVITDLFERLLTQKSYPRAQGRSAAVDEIVRILLSLQDIYASMVQQCVTLMNATANSNSSSTPDQLEQLEHACTYIVRVSSTLGEEEMDYLACHAGSDDFESRPPMLNGQPVEGCPEHKAWFGFHLNMTRHPYDLVIIERTLNVWDELQDQTVKERKYEVLKKDVFLSLLDILIRVAAYPTAFVSWTHPLASPIAQGDVASAYFKLRLRNDPDEFIRFRCGITESLFAYYGLLQLEYLDVLVKNMTNPAQQLTWQQQEAILMCLLPVAKEMETTLATYFTDAKVAIQDKQRVRASLDTIAQRIWSWTPAEGAQQLNVPAILLSTGCAWIKSFSFLLQYSDTPEIGTRTLEAHINYLLRVILATQSNKTESRGSIYAEAATSATQDAPNIAGIAFASLCSSPTSRLRLIQSPNILATIVRVLFQTPGYSPQIKKDMKLLWCTGLASLVCYLTYNDDSLQNMGAGQSMNMAKGYLHEITQPCIQTLNTLFQRINSQASSTSQVQIGHEEFESIRVAIRENLQILAAILNVLAYPTSPDALQVKEGLLGRIATELVHTPHANKPVSVALQTFSLLWPHLQQVATMVASGSMKDSETLDAVCSIFGSSVSLLYPHELTITLQQMIVSVMAIYQYIPLPSVLKLIEKTVSTSNYGAMVELRDTWNTLISQIYKLTMINTKENLKGHIDVYCAFFDLQTSFYENCTYCYITNPGNTLTHVIQFSVTLLDSLAQSRDIFQKVLFFLETIVGGIQAIDILPEKLEMRHIFSQIWTEQGGGLIRQLLSNIGEVIPTLMPNKIATIIFHSLERFPQLTRSWLEKGLMSDYFRATAPNLSEEDIQTFLSLMWPLADNKHQFKALFIQFNQVCTKQDTMESLMMFSLVANPSGGTRLRGSPRMDAAFASI